METNNLQTQIDELNRKLDLILEYTITQKQNSQVTTDLVNDLAIVGTDLYKTTVSELDKRMIEIDPEQIQLLLINLMKNVKNFNHMLSLLESVVDFTNDATPLAREMIIDMVDKLHVAEQKGYFEFFAEIFKAVDNVVTHFSKEDVAALADNMVGILETVKSITQPEVLNSVHNAVKVFNSIEMNNIPEYSVWRLMREINTPEMKRAMGFAVTLVKNMSQTNNKIN